MTLRLPSLHTGPRSGALRRTQAVYTHNVLHFAQPPVDDESVKISNLTRNRSSAPPSVLPASRPGIERPPKRQFLFSTNEPLSLTQNFVNPTKQSTSFFYSVQVSGHQSPLMHTSTGSRPRCVLEFTPAPLFRKQYTRSLGTMKCPGRTQPGETTRRGLSH